MTLNTKTVILSTTRRFKLYKIIAAAIILLIIQACDHTDLTGEIVSDNNKFIVGDSIQLSLKIQSELDGIYWIHWEVEPKEAGEIIYSEPSENKRSKSIISF